MERTLVLTEVDDLRSAAMPSYAPARSLPPGTSGAFGPGVPIGSPAYAAADARAITPASVPSPPEPIAGWRASGSFGADERFSVRVPRRWNGRLVVAGTPAQRSEFACDRLFADPLLARGYAYAAGNKGVGDGVVLLAPGATFALDGVTLPRFPLPGGAALSLWQHAPGKTMERWAAELLAVTDVAHEIVAQVHRTTPEWVYAVGLSNGGYEVRRAIESSDRFAGALTWNAVLWTPEHNVLRQLPPAIAAMEAGTPERLVGLGFPPDVAGLRGGSLYAKNLVAYWYLTAWLHAVHLDPQTSIAYGDVVTPEPADAWATRIGDWRLDRDPRIAARIAGFANTGAIRCKLIDLASELDHLIPPAEHFAPYAALVRGAGRAERYRGRLLPDAQHVDAWSEDPDYPRLRPGWPQVMEAFDELVRWVE
ncbi:MAG TPA: hypothetical protein VMD91_09685 [Candidatus Sulfotelmatobacter sp.]|nr:hypothetical protein [Candidatus Sulfotelmatobacter sp.]